MKIEGGGGIFLKKQLKRHTSSRLNHIPALSDDQSLNLCVKSNIKT